MLSTTSLFGENVSLLRDRNFQILLLANVLPAMGTALISPVLDSLVEPFGTSATSIGLMMSAYTAPQILIIPIAGKLADTYGRKLVLVAGLLLFGTAGGVIALTASYPIVLALRFLQGVGFAGITPVITTIIGDLYSGNEEVSAQGFRFAGSGTTQTLMPVIASLLVVVGWQFPFLVYLIAIPIALAVFLGFDEPLYRDTSESEHAHGGTGAASRLRDLLVRPGFLAVIAGSGTPFLVWIGFLTYNSILVVRVMGGTVGQAGLLAATGSLFYAIAGMQAGRVDGFFTSSIRPLAIASVGMSAGFAIIFAAPTVPVAFVGVAVSGLGFGITLTLYRSYITGVAPPSLRAGSVSVMEAFDRLVSTVTPALMGGLAALLTPTFGFGTAVRVTGLFVAGSAVVVAMACLAVTARWEAQEEIHNGSSSE